MKRIKRDGPDPVLPVPLVQDSIRAVQPMNMSSSVERRKIRRREVHSSSDNSNVTEFFLETQRRHSQNFGRLTRSITFYYCILLALSFFGDNIPTAFAFVPRSSKTIPSSTRKITTPQPTPISRITHSRITSFPSTATTTTLFGIKGFRAWFQDQFPNAIRNVDVSQHTDRFDHVLIDMNQILHVILRRSRNTEQATKLLMVELDILIERCNPTHSLVLAIDGSPAAAKLATQRKRRFSILKNTQFKLKHSDKLRMSKRRRAKRLRNYKSELQSLQLTPGTECMQTMESALLYWAWQRLQSQGKPNSRLLPRVRIYISSSLVPGEGEIKLLEWINNHRLHLSKRPGQSIALVGGDADLLLEAMVIPPSWTHNVFVLRPEESSDKPPSNSNDSNGNEKSKKMRNSSSETNKQASKKKSNKKYNRKNMMHCTSLWEMTLSLDDYCRNNIPKQYYDPETNPGDENLLLQIRTDMVMLFMLNGNDYLPRVVAVGFRGVLKSYLVLLEAWIKRKGSARDVGLVDPNTLNFRSDFCANFFHILGLNAPSEQERWRSVKYSARRTYQSVVNDMSAIGFLPSPVKFRFVGGSINGQQNDGDGREVQERESIFAEEQDDDDEDIYDKDDEDDDDDMEALEDDYKSIEYGPEVEVMQLTLGNMNDNDYHQYNIRVNTTSPKGVQKAKRLLSRMALKDFSLLDYVNMNIDGNDVGTDYEWEIDRPADANVERYLGGLIWTLQTYQDGVCPSYHYNYGKCLAPSGRVIAAYFEKAVQENKNVGAADLLRDFKPGGSVSAGAACLAALPISVKDLVPKPYSLIDDEKVEDYYSQCMNPVDNFFQLKKFEILVDAEIKRLAQVERIMGGENDTEEEEGSSTSNFFSGRRIVLGDHYWTVIKRTRDAIPHPFKPPPPPAENFYRLRPNNRIKVSRIISMDFPSPRPSLNYTMAGNLSHETNYPRKIMERNNIDIDHLNFGSLLNGSASSILEIPYKVAFGSSPDMYGGMMKSKNKTSFKLLRSKQINVSLNLNSSNGNRKDDGITKRLPVTVKNPDNQNALVILKQLRDIQLVGVFEFGESTNGESTEVTLTISREENSDNTLLDGSSFSHSIYSSKRSLASTKQYLASLALDAIMHSGKPKGVTESDTSEEDRSKIRWYDLTFQGMKDFLELQHSATKKDSSIDLNPENQTSLVILKQLSDIGMVVAYQFDETPASSEYPEKISLSVSLGSTLSPENILFEQYRTKESKKLIKQQLASLALETMISGGKSTDKDSDPAKIPHWYDLTFNDTKDLIKRNHFY
uniref:Xrn1 N-terminal domain-containing protein n=1 Tax=Pseudo-nitzschia australis TaxID=44445 RepID=A0A7S4EEN9_9STRA